MNKYVWHAEITVLFKHFHSELVAGRKNSRTRLTMARHGRDYW